MQVNNIIVGKEAGAFIRAGLFTRINMVSPKESGGLDLYCIPPIIGWDFSLQKNLKELDPSCKTFTVFQTS